MAVCMVYAPLRGATTLCDRPTLPDINSLHFQLLLGIVCQLCGVLFVLDFWKFCQLYVYSTISLVGVLMLLSKSLQVLSFRGMFLIIISTDVFIARGLTESEF